MQKTIGILGGMGPYATLEFYKQILDNTKGKKDSDHYRILIDSNTKIPSRTRAILYGEETPVKKAIEAINNLANAGADFVVLPCNSIHYWYNDISKKIKIPWPSMINIVSKKLKGKKTLVIGAHIVTELKLYDNKVDAIYIKDKKIADDAIYNIKKNGYLDDNGALLNSIIKMRSEFDIVLLGCTEYTVIKKDLEQNNIPYLDSSLEYALWVIEHAKNK